MIHSIVRLVGTLISLKCLSMKGAFSAIRGIAEKKSASYCGIYEHKLSPGQNVVVTGISSKKQSEINSSFEWRTCVCFSYWRLVQSEGDVKNFKNWNPNESIRYIPLCESASKSRARFQNCQRGIQCVCVCVDVSFVVVFCSFSFVVGNAANLWCSEGWRLLICTGRHQMWF